MSLGECSQCWEYPCRCSGGEIGKLKARIADLEAKEKRGCVHNDLVYLEEVIARKNEKIVSLEATLASFALVDESRRAEVDERDKRIAELELELSIEIYEHWSTCDGEGLEWCGDIPETPVGYGGGL